MIRRPPRSTRTDTPFPTRRSSDLLDRNNGFEIALPYYLRLAPNRDLTVTPHVYTEAVPMVEGEFRALTDFGSFRINGYATYSSVVPINDTSAAPTTGTEDRKSTRLNSRH